MLCASVAREELASLLNKYKEQLDDMQVEDFTSYAREQLDKLLKDVPFTKHGSR